VPFDVVDAFDIAGWDFTDLPRDGAVAAPQT
jgi:hypothetical protein